MTSALDTQEIETSQPVGDTQETIVFDKSQSKQTQVEEKPLKESNLQVPSFPSSTIDLTNSEEEEDEGLSPMTDTEEVGNGNNLQEDMNVFSGSNGRSSSALPRS